MHGLLEALQRISDTPQVRSALWFAPPPFTPSTRGAGGAAGRGAVDTAEPMPRLEAGLFDVVS
jgi:hypothetical protein